MSNYVNNRIKNEKYTCVSNNVGKIKAIIPKEVQNYG